jgi:hypothetical protein
MRQGIDKISPAGCVYTSQSGLLPNQVVLLLKAFQRIAEELA